MPGLLTVTALWNQSEWLEDWKTSEMKERQTVSVKKCKWTAWKTCQAPNINLPCCKGKKLGINQVTDFKSIWHENKNASLQIQWCLTAPSFATFNNALQAFIKNKERSKRSMHILFEGLLEDYSGLCLIGKPCSKNLRSRWPKNIF